MRRRQLRAAQHSTARHGTAQHSRTAQQQLVNSKICIGLGCARTSTPVDCVNTCIHCCAKYLVQDVRARHSPTQMMCGLLVCLRVDSMVVCTHCCADLLHFNTPDKADPSHVCCCRCTSPTSFCSACFSLHTPYSYSLAAHLITVRWMMPTLLSTLLLSTRGTLYLSALRTRYSWMSRMLPM